MTLHLHNPVEIIRSYNLGWFGSHGVYEGLRDVLAGRQRVVTYAVAPHPAHALWHDRPAAAGTPKLVTIGRGVVDGQPTWRFCGGDDGRDPDGFNSHALVATWEPDELALAAAGLGIYLQRQCKEGWAIYRQPEEGQTP
jgi:hypothetical protein